MARRKAVDGPKIWKKGKTLAKPSETAYNRGTAEAVSVVFFVKTGTWKQTVFKCLTGPR